MPASATTPSRPAKPTTNHPAQGRTAAAASRPAGRGASRSGSGAGPTRSPRAPGGEPVKTWVFDSVGDRKYAIQIRKASNGNPCVRIVEGVPQATGEYRKFNVTVWSEDFDAFFRMFDDVRAFIRDNDIKTPKGHKYVPGKPRSGPPQAPRRQGDFKSP